MPKLDPTELGPVGSLRCRRVGCTRGALLHGRGFQLPFCREDLTGLSRRTFDQLVELASLSVFDIDAVAEAAAVVAAARLELRGKRARK
jgi:hypothetical protein